MADMHGITTCLQVFINHKSNYNIAISAQFALDPTSKKEVSSKHQSACGLIES